MGESTSMAGSGNVSMHFSQQTFDIQKGFCCSNTDNRKIIRWQSCQPGVFRSSQTLFSSRDLALCNWFQVVEDYSFTTITLDPGEVIDIEIEGKYILAKANWPSTALEESKLIEIGIGEQGGYIGQTIPFLIGSPLDNSNSFKFMIMKDLFHINTMSDFSTPLKLNNISSHSCSISLLYAK